MRSTEFEPGELDPQTLDAIDRAEDETERREGVNWTDVRENVRAKLRGR